MAHSGELLHFNGILKLKHLVLALTVLAAAASPLTSLADQPPLIDRHLFYGEGVIAGAQISPDGPYLSFLKPYQGPRKLWVKGPAQPFRAARPRGCDASRPLR